MTSEADRSPHSSPEDRRSEPAGAENAPESTAVDDTTTRDTDGPEAGDTGHGADDEVVELVGELTAQGEMNPAERQRLLGRLTRAVARAGAKVSGTGRGRWLTEVFMSLAPRVPIRDLHSLQEHHYGLTGEQLADDLIRTAAKATMTVGAVGGALAAAEFAAPPLLLSAPAQLVAETLVVSAIEVKLIAELHEVYGVRVPGTGPQRAMAFALAWSKQRGIDPMAPNSMMIALGTGAKTALRHRLLRTLRRHLTTLGPFLTGAIAGGALNRVATKRLAEAVRADLRRQRGLA